MADPDDGFGPLPPGWATRRSRSKAGKIYYVNESLKKTTWNRPSLQSPSSPPPVASATASITSPQIDPSPSPIALRSKDQSLRVSYSRAKPGPPSTNPLEEVPTKRHLSCSSGNQQWSPKFMATRRIPQRVTPSNTPGPTPRRVPLCPCSVTLHRRLVSTPATRATPQRVPAEGAPKSATPKRIPNPYTPSSASLKQGPPPSGTAHHGASPKLKPASRKRHNSDSEHEKVTSMRIWDKSPRTQLDQLKETKETSTKSVSAISERPNQDNASHMGKPTSPLKKEKIVKSEMTPQSCNTSPDDLHPHTTATDRVILRAKRQCSGATTSPSDHVTVRAKRQCSSNYNNQSSQRPALGKIPRKQDRPESTLSVGSDNNNTDIKQEFQSSASCRAPSPLYSFPRSDIIDQPGNFQIDGPSQSLACSQTMSRIQEDEERNEMDMEVEFEKASQDINLIRNAQTSYNLEAVGNLTQSIANTAAVAPTSNQSSLYVVVDTNIFIGGGIRNLDELKDKKFKGLGRPYLVIPWVVLQELDNYKDALRRAKAQIGLRTQMKANNSVQYLNGKLTSQHPQFIFQTPDDCRVAKRYLRDECNDDRILQCCQHCCEKYAGSHVVLLSQDVNLHNKALVTGLKVSRLQDITQYLSNLAALEAPSLPATLSSLDQNPSLLNPFPQPSAMTSFHTSTPSSGDFAPPVAQSSQSSLVPSPKVDESKLADDVLCDVKAVLKDLLAAVLEEEMVLVYDDIWQLVVYRKPPWTLEDILDSMIKHWIAVFGLIVPRKEQNRLEEIQKLIREKYGLKLARVEALIATAVAFLRGLPVKRSYNVQLVSAVSLLKELKAHVALVLNGSISVSQAMSERSGAPAISATGPPASTSSPTPDGDQAACASQTAGSEMTEQEVNTVQQQFQLTYEAILSACECMGAVVTSTQGVMCPARLEALQFFHELMQMLMAIELAYKGMLSCDHPSPHTFSVLCDTINGFATSISVIPWQPMEAWSLQRFYDNPARQNILRNGYEQLINFLRELEALWLTLTPEERVVVQPNG